MWALLLLLSPTRFSYFAFLCHQGDWWMAYYGALLGEVVAYVLWMNEDIDEGLQWTQDAIVNM